MATTISASGTSVHYIATGSGNPLVLVHGAGGNSEANWGHLRARFDDRRQVITPNYAGSGETTDPGGDIDLNLAVEQVAASILAADAGPVELVGFSLGSLVAASLAAKHPELVKKLVLIAGWVTHADPRQELVVGLWRKLADADLDIYRKFLTLYLFSPRHLGAQDRQALAQSLEGIEVTANIIRQIELVGRATVEAFLPSIQTPTLVVGLTQDQLVPVENARAMHRAIRGSIYREIDSGHLVVWERPEELVAEILNFLDKTPHS
ncbi:alpha/beta hydrolase [Pendulispora brunnea]|uniref:Alpha/beta hydrolase n=1 Tax=Pendulispora brunnea TaxID=2905690 RepID=A0ABZ2KCW4_9BACT